MDATPPVAEVVPPEPYHNRVHRTLLGEHVKDAAQAHARGRLLDVGCGTKPYAAFFAPLVASYTGLDVEDRGGADVIGSALELPFEGGSFDTVVSFQVIEHVPDPQRMLQECSRVLAPGGRLILTAPFAWPIHEAPTDFFRYSEYGLRLLLERSGLDVLEIRPMEGFWTYAGTRASYFLAARSTRKGALHRALCLALQRFGLTLDRRYPNPDATHNYTVVAGKPEAV